MKAQWYLILAALAASVAFADPPAPRMRPAEPQSSFRQAIALCRDDRYVCMYRCQVGEGNLCTPTVGSDRGCPEHQVTGGSWVNDKLVILRFEKNASEMVCKVTSPPMTNLVCGMGEFGWGCHVGKWHNANKDKY
jgi:hypothetical protein